MADKDTLQPKISVYSQYIKDLSFENPSMLTLMPSEGAPEVELSLDVLIKDLQDAADIYEVSIYISAKTSKNNHTLFHLELTYSGIFNVVNFTEEERKVILAVHCPSLIFPFARRIIANVTQDGGFQPLMLEPIDFALLYQKRLQQELNASRAS